MKRERSIFHIMESFRKLNFSSMLPGITHGEFAILKIISEKEESGKQVKVSSIIRQLNCSPPAVSRSLKGLEQQGYILRKVDPTDRRNTYVDITELGLHVMREAEEIMKSFAQSIFTQLGNEKMEDIERLLKDLYRVSKTEVDARKYKDREEI